MPPNTLRIYAFFAFLLALSLPGCIIHPEPRPACYSRPYYYGDYYGHRSYFTYAPWYGRPYAHYHPASPPRPRPPPRPPPPRPPPPRPPRR